MAERIVVTIVVDRAGHMSLETEGPVKGKTGLLALLDAAKELAGQMHG